MLTVAELVARLRADNSHFSRGMAQAERDLMRVEKVGSSVSRSLAGLGQKFNAVASGVALAGVTAAGSLAAVGSSYNTLLQKTNAAFTTLLGSADKAKVMITDLTDFARESPFPRQVFIAATQQLLGFGMAADKIIPSFAAIQDAVAATGGGASEIQQFVDIFAQIKSFGRANTETLMRFSYAGIDAFKLLADQAGVSVGEMRKQVTEGMLDADSAIEMLTSGLTDKFAGAAAGVKNTWLGTKDRIAGAWRDIGSALVAPFIGPQGGGMLVEVGNALGDLLRLIANDYAPRAGAAIADFVDQWRPLIEDFDAPAFMDKVTGAFDKFQDSADSLLPVLAALGVGFGAAGANMIPFLGQFLPAVGGTARLVMALGALVLSNEDARASLMGLGDALGDSLGAALPSIVPMLNEMLEAVAALVPPLVEVATAALSAAWPAFAAGLKIAVTVVDTLASGLKPVAELLADHPGLVQMVVAAWAAFKVASIASSIGSLTVRLQAMAAAQRAVSVATAAGTGVQGGAAGMAAINANMARFGTLAGAGTAAVGSLRAGLSALGRVAGPMMVIMAAFEIANAFRQADAEVAEFRAGLMEEIGDLPAAGAVRHLRQEIARLKEESGSDKGGSGIGSWGPLGWINEQIDTHVTRRVLGGRDSVSDSDPGKIKAAEQALRQYNNGLRIGKALSADLGRAIGRVVPPVSNLIVSMANGTYQVKNFGSAAAQALVGIGQLTDGILEAAAATDAAMQDYTSPMGAFSAVQGGDDPAEKVRDLADAQRDYASAAADVQAAQDRVNEVLTKQFDAAEHASDAIAELADAHRAAFDPVFKYLKAQTDLNKVMQDVERAVQEENKITVDPGATLEERVGAISTLESSAIGLAGAVASGQISLSSLTSTIDEWVRKGMLTTEQAGSLTAKVNEAITAANNQFGGQVNQAIATKVSEKRVEFDREQARDLAEARRGVEDALQRAADAAAKITEVTAEINGTSLDGFNGNIEKSAVTLAEWMGQMTGNVEDMRLWMDDIRAIAAKGGPELAQEILKWGPQMAPLVREIARSTPDAFNDFVTLMQEKMGLTSNAMHAELETMKWMAENASPQIVAELERQFALTPEKLGTIFGLVGDGFGETMDILAGIAEAGGRASMTTLVDKMAEQWGVEKEEAHRIITELGGKWGELNTYIHDLDWTVVIDGKISDQMASLLDTLGVSRPGGPQPGAPNTNGTMFDGLLGGLGIAPAATAAPATSNPLSALAGLSQADILNLQRMKNGGFTDAEMEFLRSMDPARSRPTQLNRGGIRQFAEGGIIALESYANGGMRMPKIAHGIQFAEPETHGEAYIPLALSKRARSMALLGQVAGLFGMSLAPSDSGDFYSQGKGGGGASTSETRKAEFTSVVNHYGPDSGVDRGVRELEKMSYRSGWSD